MTAAQTTAAKFLSAARDAGYTVAVRGTVVSIAKRFTPGDRDAFVACDGDYYGLLAMLPARGGSMWGTDGGSVGGYVALKDGAFVMNVSGVSARVAAAVAAG
jgi:hypothetical protein